MRGVDEEEEKAKAAKKGKKSLDKKKETTKATEEKVEESGETGGGEEGGKKEGAEKEATEEEAAAKPAEDEWKPFIPEVPSQIHWALYSSPDTFWLSMDDYDAGYLYECRLLDETTKAKMPADKIDEPLRAVPVFGSDLTHSDDIPLTCLLFK